MEDKTNYTHKEFEDAFDAYLKYDKAFFNYCMKETENDEELSSPVLTSDEYKEQLNQSVEDCNKKIPKSLIDKLGIKKVE
jgi:hypothetical protein